MEYCDGGDLSQRISEARDAGRALDEELALDWFAQLVLAVAFAHSRRVLHRASGARLATKYHHDDALARIRTTLALYMHPSCASNYHLTQAM